MTNSLVVDTSAVVDALLFGRGSSAIDTALLHAPSVLDYEFLHVMRRASRSKEIGASRAREALDGFLQVQIERHPARPLLQAMWAHRQNFSAYDASYVALAEALGVPLVTSDRRLARAAQRWCEVVALA